MVAAVGLLVYVGFSFRTKYQGGADLVDYKMSDKPANAALVQDSLRVPKSLDLYTFQINQRDIFSATTGNAQSQPALQTAAGSSVAQLPASYKIVGIVLGKPSEVVIEDTSLKQTLFMLEGETQGDIKVEHIDKDGVTLIFQGQTQQLKIKE